MLSFLRRLRRSLIEQGHLRKYLVYAIGEILLVMIGILLAIQVNNWNQDRQDRIEEQIALANLQKDFELNRSNILASIDQLKGTINGSTMILQFTGHKYDPDEFDLDLDSLLILTTTTPRFFPQEGSLNEIINSGRLSQIRNAELRNLLSSWRTSVDYIMDRTEVNHTESLKIVDFVTEHGNWLKVDSRIGLKNADLPKSGFNTTNTSLLSYGEFESLIDVQIVFKDGLLDGYKSTLALCEQIQSKIEIELK